MAPLYSFIYLILIFISFREQQTRVRAQYVQAVTTQLLPNAGGQGNPPARVPVWRETVGSVFDRVIDIAPELVLIEYNCYYMRDICKNADNWMNTPRGQSRTPRWRFGYDFNTGKTSRTRNARRRAASCGNFKQQTTCPHTDQNLVMRHDGPWKYKDLEPGTTINEIKADVYPNGARRPSEVRYTCDEFPPATWIEGGSGSSAPEAQAMDSETRCAAFRCDKTRGVKAEQNWQATAHNALQSSLKAVINRRNMAGTVPSEFNYYRTKNSVAFFEFRYTTAPHPVNGVAAKVYTYTDRNRPPTVTKPITQAKRELIDMLNATAQTMDDDELDRAAFWRWADRVTVDELLTMGPEVVSEKHVIANHTEAAMRMPSMNLPWMNSIEWSDVDDGHEEFDEYNEVNEVNWVPLPEILSGPPRANVGKVKRAETMTNAIALTPLFENATKSDLEKARQIVEDAISKSAELNAARLANPARNRYQLKPGTMVGQGAQRRSADGDTATPALLNITDEIAAAAALVSEAEAANEFTGNLTARQVQAASSGTYWMEHIARMGTVPFGDDPSYKVFRNVLDYGAVGNGVTDDTKAIKAAMNDGKRCGEKCNGSTTKNAIIYFPPGTYSVSSTIAMPFGTQVIGDANDPPTIKASRNFIGLGVLSADEYTGGGTGPDGQDQQWYINTANFYRQIRNIKIDITQTRPVQEVAGIHYQIAQATSLQNVELIATAGSTQRGIFAENGSGGVISDVTFRGGKFGLYGGNQQFTAQRLKFEGCDTGVQIIWDWGWVWKSITMTNVGVGFRLLQEEKASSTKRQTIPGKGSNGNIGSASFIDSTFQNVETAVLIAPPNDKPGSGSTGIIIENIVFEGVSKPVADTSGAVLLEASGKVDHWALGPVYTENGPKFSMGAKVGAFRRQPELLDNSGAYFERAKPQYEGSPVGDFLHVKDFGAKGDGTTDDTAAFQRALYESQGSILFVDAGSYILTETITVPIGSRIVGETWSQLVASGSYFEDVANPKVMLQVGLPGTVGTVEMQDLIFTNRGPTAGLVLVEWNVRASTAGSAGLWDCHVRIGGALGTELTPDECPALTSGVAPGCNAGSLMMHITPQASGYFENMWLWVSDHMIDDPDLNDANNTLVQNSVYVARGMLIESINPTWLYGTASEHAVFYQYNFHKAQSIFAGMLQTESPYYQPTPNPPAPFEDAVGVFPGDPEYSCAGGDDEFGGCDESWAVIIRESANIFVAGAGLYSWFSTYTQDCIDEHTCQKVLMLLEDNHAGIRFHNVITIGAKYMAVMDGKGIEALDYLNVESHPRWSQISVMDVAGDNELAELLWIDPKIWDMDQPAFTCVPPCLVNIPPWTKATRIVDYPRITVSDGDWSTTITRRPITITEVQFEVVTLTTADNNKLRRRSAQPFGDFWPVPATTPSWPKVTYTNDVGEVLETVPNIPFPAPPASIGPNAPAPTAGGTWPKVAIRGEPGLVDQPQVGKCYWDSFVGTYFCPGVWDDEDEGGSAPNSPNDEDYGEADTICPTSTTTTTTTTRTTTTTKEPDEPTESPLEEGRPSENQRTCYNGGVRANNAQMSNTARSACRALGDEGRVISNPSRGLFGGIGSGAAGGLGIDLVISHDYELPANGDYPIVIETEVVIKPGCKFIVDYDKCHRYFEVGIDSCNCEGANGKQGGKVENNCLRFRIDPQRA